MTQPPSPATPVAANDSHMPPAAPALTQAMADFVSASVPTPSLARKPLVMIDMGAAGVYKTFLKLELQTPDILRQKLGTFSLPRGAKQAIYRLADKQVRAFEAETLQRRVTDHFASLATAIAQTVMTKKDLGGVPHKATSGLNSGRCCFPSRTGSGIGAH